MSRCRVNVEPMRTLPEGPWAVVVGDPDGPDFFAATHVPSEIAARQVARREAKRLGLDPDDYCIEGIPHRAWVPPSPAYSASERREQIARNLRRVGR